MHCLRRRRTRALSLIFGVLACAVAAGPSSGSVGRPLTPEQRARQVGAEAYIYGLAPLDEQRVIVNFPANLLINITQLTTPAQRLVPLPNVDTLYTTARLELGRSGPLLVHVPEERGRYYTLQLLDAYTNTFGYIGRRVTGTHAGTYAILPPGWRGKLPAVSGVIRSPTPTVWLLGRTLVRGSADLTKVQEIQKAYALTTLAGAKQPSLYLPGSTLHPKPVPQGLAFFDALDAFMAANPAPASDHALLRRLAGVGIKPGVAVSTERLSPAVQRGLLAGLADGARQLQRYARHLASASERHHNGWLLPPPGIGDYGRRYLLRAYVAQNALGANVPAEAIYPVTFVDRTLRTLSGHHRYLLRFARGQLPPVNAFWSLTMYDQSLFLVPNATARYAVGDRTPGLRRGRDGSLEILLQASPPGRLRSNWLPAPSGTFVLALRLYQPKPAAARGRWPLPTITRVG